MNRTVLSALAVATASMLTLTASPANAVGLTLNGAPIDHNQAVKAVAQAADTILDSGATLRVGEYSLVYDPRVIQENLDLSFQQEGANGGVRYQRGRTADGRTVVTPATGTFTSGFGPRWGTVHQGIDIANNLGSPIYAVMDGTVINAGPAQGFGNWVVIKHDGGEVSVYGHMAVYNVSVGQRVTAGQQIAQIGNEGFSTGPHLHFEIHPDGVTPVDPVPWFAQAGIRIQ